MKTKKCIHCGTEFLADGRSSAQFCSEDCSFSHKIPTTSTAQGCLEWLGTIRPDGYGRFAYKELQTLPHIYAYEREFGKQPKGTVIRHKCDNRKCVNPDHLLSGTHADNVADKVSRNRQCFGDGHSNAKLTSQEVREICDLIRNKRFMQIEIAKIYGVCKHTIYLIKKGAMWGHVGVALGTGSPARKKVKNAHARKLTAEQVEEIRSLTDVNTATLAKTYEVSKGAINNIRKRASWTHI